MLVIEGYSMEDIRSEGYLRGYQKGLHLLDYKRDYASAETFILAAQKAEKKDRAAEESEAFFKVVKAFEEAGWDSWGTLEDGVLHGIKDSMMNSTW